MPVALLALTLSAFGIGTTEFVMMGLLPQVAAETHVSIPTAGQYVSSYALGVVIGAPILTAVALRLRRKTMLQWMMVLFAVGNFLTALAPTHETLVATRFLAGLPHGAFFGVGAVVAARMVSTSQRASATARMFIGLTVANIVGVPVGTLLGQQLGWRPTFVVVAVIGVAAVAAITALIPRDEPTGPVRLGRELTAFRRGQVWLGLAIVGFGFGGTFASYSYIAPMMTDLAGFASASVTLLLSLFGVGMTVGAYVGGKLADRSPIRTLMVSLPATAVVLATFVFTAHNPVLAPINLLLVGFTSTTAVPCVQMIIIEKAKDAPSLASAAIQSAFNIANSIGAYLGGAVIAAGWGLAAPNAVGSGLAVVGIGLVIALAFAQRRDSGTGTPGRGLGRLIATSRRRTAAARAADLEPATESA